MTPLEFILDIVFPKFCLGCGQLGTYICSSCSSHIAINSNPLCPGCLRSSSSLLHSECRPTSVLDGLYALCSHDTIIRQLISDAKYKTHFDLYSAVIPSLATYMPRQFISCHALVPVPLHTKRFYERGYNQSEVLAQKLGKRINKPVLTSILTRRKDTQAQVHLTRRERLANVDDAFVAKTKLPVSSTLLLIDDVTTTGATISSCAKALKQAGATTVYGLVIAHGK